MLHSMLLTLGPHVWSTEAVVDVDAHPNQIVTEAALAHTVHRPDMYSSWILMIPLIHRHIVVIPMVS